VGVLVVFGVIFASRTDLWPLTVDQCVRNNPGPVSKVYSPLWGIYLHISC
jgi:hypothetical protein